jgi:DNA polymerase III epsilon subunit-like protein
MQQYMKTKCLYNSVSSVPHINDLTQYEGMINPIDLDFAMDLNTDYIVLGCKFWNNTAWLYVIPNDKKDELIDIAPVVLFDFARESIPRDWVIKIDPENNKSLEILPKFLADIPNWFERYMDEEEEIVEAINKEILNLKQRDQPSKPEDPYAWPFEEYK